MYAKYYYILYTKNFWYEVEIPSGGNEIDLFKSGYFHIILELLEHIQEVKRHYHFFRQYITFLETKRKTHKNKKNVIFFPKEENECSICYK